MKDTSSTPVPFKTTGITSDGFKIPAPRAVRSAFKPVQPQMTFEQQQYAYQMQQYVAHY